VAVVANVAVNVDARNAINSLHQVNRAAGQTQAGFNKLQSTTQALDGAFVGLAASAAAFNAQKLVGSFVAAANAADGAQRRIRLVSQGFDDYRTVLGVAKAAADKFGLSQTQAASAIADIYTRLRPVGFQLNEINAIYEGFNTAVKLSGVSAEAASIAFLQLSQGLGSGTLQGDELRSVLEQMPSITQAIAKELGVSAGAIKQFGSEGKITSDVIVRALDRIRTEGADKLAEALDTPQQRIVNLQNAFEQFKIAVGSSIAPLVISSIEGITEALKDATEYVENLRAGFDLLGKAASGLTNLEISLGGINKKLEDIGANKGLMLLLDFITLGVPSTVGLVAEAGKKKRGRRGYSEPALPGGGAGTPPDLPTRLSMQGRQFGGGVGGKGGASKAANEAQRAAEAAAKEAERVAQVVRERLAEGQVLQLRSEIQDKIAAAEIAGDKQLAIRLQGQQKELDIQYKYAQALAQEKNVRAQQAIIFQAQTEIVANNRDIQRQLNEEQNNSAIRQIDALQKIIGLQVELTEQQKQQKEVAEGIANTVGQGLTSAFDALIQGSEDFGASLRKIASGVLVDIAKQLLQVFVIQKAISAISGLFGGGGGFGGGLPTSYAGVQVNPLVTAGLPSFKAKGGPVRGGSPYVVGERGPELFVPNSSGSIVPNSQLGGMGGNVSVTVNVDASGSQVQGDANQAKALGGVISAAVQSEIIKQQRPGGLLAGTR